MVLGSWTVKLELEGMSFILLLLCRIVFMKPQITSDMPTHQSLCLDQSQQESKRRAGSLKSSCESIEWLENKHSEE